MFAPSRLELTARVGDVKMTSILRPKAAYAKMGCGKTKFRDDYELTDPAKPNVPGTKIKRVKAMPLGPRNVGFLEHEIDALIHALAKAGGTRVSAPRKRAEPVGTTHVFVTDAMPPQLAHHPQKPRGRNDRDP
jgi:hypothetical protein